MPNHLQKLITQMLEQQPENRIQTFDEVQQQLIQKQETATPLSIKEEATSKAAPTTKRKAKLYVGLSILLLISINIAFFTWLPPKQLMSDIQQKIPYLSQFMETSIHHLIEQFIPSTKEPVTPASPKLSTSSNADWEKKRTFKNQADDEDSVF